MKAGELIRLTTGENDIVRNRALLHCHSGCAAVFVYHQKLPEINK